MLTEARGPACTRPIIVIVILSHLPDICYAIIRRINPTSIHILTPSCSAPPPPAVCVYVSLFVCYGCLWAHPIRSAFYVHSMFYCVVSNIPYHTFLFCCIDYLWFPSWGHQICTTLSVCGYVSQFVGETLTRAMTKEAPTMKHPS